MSAAGTLTAAVVRGAFPRESLEAQHPECVLEESSALLSLVDSLSGD